MSVLYQGPDRWEMRMGIYVSHCILIAVHLGRCCVSLKSDLSQ